METGENPVRARRREVQNAFLLPEAANRGQAIGRPRRRRKVHRVEILSDNKIIPGYTASAGKREENSIFSKGEKQ